MKNLPKYLSGENFSVILAWTTDEVKAQEAKTEALKILQRINLRETMLSFHFCQ
jgi:hypothetical protein